MPKRVSSLSLKLCECPVLCEICGFLDTFVPQCGLLWIRACVRWRDESWERNSWFPQLDPVPPAGEEQAPGLQGIQGQRP